MKVFRVLLVLLLAGCGGATAPAPSPTVSPVAEVSPTPTLVVPLMDGLPTGFAPCAGNAKTVKQAAYNCLRDWKPGPHPPATLVYHFSPSVSKRMQNNVKKATELTLDYSAPLLTLLGYEPTYHIFVNGEGVESAAGRAWCKQEALSYAGTATQDWIWSRPEQSRGPCTTAGGGGRGVPSTIPGHAAAWITKGPYGWGNEDFWSLEVLPAELSFGIHAQYFEAINTDAPGSNEVLQRWVQYLPSNTLARTFQVQLNEANVETMNALIWTHDAGNQAVTWQPTYRGWLCPESDSPRAQSCGVAQDLPAAETAIPWNYTLYGYASVYVTAVFGPEWISTALWPALAAEFGGENSVYYEEMDRVAYRLWGGTWSDIEEALDTYLISELKAEGFTGLK